jgi:hypothetical protein
MPHASTLLLVNGIVLGTIASTQFVMDFVGYFTGFGPMGAALHATSIRLASRRRTGSRRVLR